MDKNGINAQLAEYETPFADVPVLREQTRQSSPIVNLDNFLLELEGPFSRTFETAATSNRSSPGSEDYVELLGELDDSEFNNTLYELANELEDSWINKISNEAAMGENFVPFVTQQAEEYFQPLLRESEAMVDTISNHFTANNLADHSELDLEAFFSEMEFNHGQFSPAQEQFLGKIFNKVKSVVKKGVSLAKKGISAVGKILPINIVLNKLKGLIKPLLNKVLKFAIGKLPKNLQQHARSLAKKFLKMETAEEAVDTDAFVSSAGDLDAIQTEFDNQVAQLLFVSEEFEADQVLMEYESSYENLERSEGYETGVITIPTLEVARQRLVNDLANLGEDNNPTVAIERFLPAAILALQPAIKIAISIIGRQRVINFLAGLLARLVAKYIPSNVAKPLAASIIDVGMGAIGFETYELDKPTVGYEAIVNTIQETIQNIGSMDEHELDDDEALTMRTLEAFEFAAANNFPSQYIREELRRSIQPGVWILKPRNGAKHLYKKFSRVFNVIIDPQTAKHIKTFRGLPLSSFLSDKLGLNPNKPIKAKVHLYEAIKGSMLSLISKHENLPGLNSRQAYAWVQLHTLTPDTSSLLLKEPALGKQVNSRFTSSRHRIAIGQRFYFLEIENARLRIPSINHSGHKHKGTSPNTSKPSQSSDIQGVVNFIKSEIRFNYYFSEEEAKSVVEKLNRNDFLGAALSIRYSVREVLHKILIKNIGNKVKIIHEAVPEIYLDNYSDPQEQFAPLAAIGRAVGGLAVSAGKEVVTKIIEKLVDKLSELAYQAVVNFFKARAAEFKQAQLQPQDGVTVKIIWINIPGMSTIRAAINAIRGNLSVGNLADLVLPNIPTPEVKILADKKFD